MTHAERLVEMSLQGGSVISIAAELREIAQRMELQQQDLNACYGNAKNQCIALGAIYALCGHTLDGLPEQFDPALFINAVNELKAERDSLAARLQDRDKARFSANESKVTRDLMSERDSLAARIVELLNGAEQANADRERLSRSIYAIDAILGTVYHTASLMPDYEALEHLAVKVADAARSVVREQGGERR